MHLASKVQFALIRLNEASAEREPTGRQTNRDVDIGESPALLAFLVHVTAPLVQAYVCLRLWLTRKRAASLTFDRSPALTSPCWARQLAHKQA